MCQTARDRLAGGAKATAREAQLYEDLVMHVLYYRRHAMLERVIRMYDDGSFWLDMSYFSFHHTNRRAYADKLAIAAGVIIWKILPM